MKNIVWNATEFYTIDVELFAKPNYKKVTSEYDLPLFFWQILGDLKNKALTYKEVFELDEKIHVEFQKYDNLTLGHTYTKEDTQTNNIYFDFNYEAKDILDGNAKPFYLKMIAYRFNQKILID